jgi:hypothetical protein
VGETGPCWGSYDVGDRALQLPSADREVDKRRVMKIAVQVVDMFGNDTMTIVDLSLKK